jgi:hypothetical protein
MKFRLIIECDPDYVLNTYTENTGIPTEEITLTLEEIIKEELSWLAPSEIYVKEIEQINEQ